MTQTEEARREVSTAVPLSLCRADLARLLAMTAIAFAVLGYHPFAEDGGIYGAALAHRMQPSLFPWDAVWLEGHTRLSLFVPVTAWTFGRLHMRSVYGLLLLQVVSLFTTLCVVVLLARLCFVSRKAANWSGTLVAVCAGLPIAGTSLYWIDPYVTARSFSTPLLLGAAVYALQRRWVWAALLWAAALTMHPLMAGWGGLPLLLLAVRSRASSAQTWRRWMTISFAVLVALGLLQWHSQSASLLTRSLAQTRAYWFLSQWRWYEIVGALAPAALLSLGATLFWRRCHWTEEGRALAGVAAISSAVGVFAALLFAHAGARSFAVARLQPLRTLHFTYGALLLLLAGSLYEVGEGAQPRWRNLRVGAVAVAAALTMAFTQHVIYRHSGAMELPWASPQNGWVQAFEWVERNTGKAERVALDARYTEADGEDAQGFRAIALRSTLPDAAKDAGVAAVIPELEKGWSDGVRAQVGLNLATDAERIVRLRSYGVHWLVIPATATTAFVCPYANRFAKVCRLP